LLNKTLGGDGISGFSHSLETKNKISEKAKLRKGTIPWNKGKKIGPTGPRSKETCLKKYGVEHSSQNQEIMEKASKKSYQKKAYIFPSTRLEYIQGYEKYALDELLHNENIEEDKINIGCKNVPTIWYEDEIGKKHRHYVDIFIPSQNRCIEVKSTWTAIKKKDNIFLKQKAGKELGYQYEIWIYDGKGKLVERHV
jgi:hypothetical protein